MQNHTITVNGKTVLTHGTDKDWIAFMKGLAILADKEHKELTVIYEKTVNYRSIVGYQLFPHGDVIEVSSGNLLN